MASLKRKNEKYRENQRFKIDRQVQSFFGRVLNLKKKRPDFTPTSKYEAILFYSVTDLFNHLENNFLTGMNWLNFGQWHVDHIKPVSSFNYSTMQCKEFLICWGLENLRPLWALDNLRKRNKIEGV